MQVDFAFSPAYESPVTEATLQLDRRVIPASSYPEKARGSPQDHNQSIQRAKIA